MNLDFHELLDLTHDLPGWSYKWICACCLINAKAGILLEFQLRDIANNLFVYFDTDETPWVRCRRCKHKFHLTCITCMTPAELLATGDFVCCANWTRFVVICFHRIFDRRSSGRMCFPMCTVLCYCVCLFVRSKLNLYFDIAERWLGRSTRSRRSEPVATPTLQMWQRRSESRRSQTELPTNRKRSKTDDDTKETNWISGKKRTWRMRLKSE